MNLVMWNLMCWIGWRSCLRQKYLATGTVTLKISRRCTSINFSYVAEPFLGIFLPESRVYSYVILSGSGKKCQYKCTIMLLVSNSTTLLIRQQACLDIDEALKHCNCKEDYDRIKHIATELASDQGYHHLVQNYNISAVYLLSLLMFLKAFLHA